MEKLVLAKDKTSKEHRIIAKWHSMNSPPFQSTWNMRWWLKPVYSWLNVITNIFRWNCTGASIFKLKLRRDGLIEKLLSSLLTIMCDLYRIWIKLTSLVYSNEFGLQMQTEAHCGVWRNFTRRKNTDDASQWAWLGVNPWCQESWTVAKPKSKSRNRQPWARCRRFLFPC